MTRTLNAAALLVTVLVAGCTVTAAPSLAPTVVPSPPAATTAPTEPSAPSPAAAAVVPPGRILFYRTGSDGLEHYFTIRTDGTDEHALFTADGCGCARFSPDGTRIVTMGATGRIPTTWSLMTMRPDGGDPVVFSPPIETLTLAQPVSNLSFERIAFSAWDDTDPSRNGLYIASPDLAGLRHVLRQPKDVIDLVPYGVTPDGSRILFFSETGPDGGFTHAGDIFVISSKGTNVRQLNPAGTKVGFVDLPPVSLSPDGRQAAFAVDQTVYVVDVKGGEARPIAERTGATWAVSWSPTGDWIVYTRQHGGTSVISLIRPDGTDQREISANLAADESSAAVWSPDGRYLLVRRGVDEGRHRLWIMDIEGTHIAPVTNESSRYGNYSWGPTTEG